VGASWFLEKQQVADGFEAVFRFQITNTGGLGPGADGLAFVLQNEGPNAIAGRGSAGGFALGGGWGIKEAHGIPRSIAVFFDTYKNIDGEDPSDNYVAICTNGPIPSMRWPPNRLGVGRKLNVRLKDGRVHLARIRYRPPMMSVYLDDGEPEVRVPVDLRTVTDELGAAYVGFTASTGNGYANHDILAWSFTPVAPSVTSDISVVESRITFQMTKCMEGRNLCTPPEAVVEERGPGQFHVILPAHLPWGASIPNPNGRSVSVSRPQGYVCWDPQAREGCSGPEGIAPADSGGLLVPGSNLGALVMKPEKGRTWFSVNGTPGRGFSANEGAFEFDVVLK
jgi:Legume lectin domain